MGTLVLMGSGELTATMVEVHKMLLARLDQQPRAVFLDTPAGFQLNADQISAAAAEYFRRNVGCDLQVASYKAHETISDIDGALAYQRLREADYILMGPGSPTYTVNQLLPSSVPDIFINHLQEGGCLVAASAAALTTGRHTLPVYEIYKVGMEPHWTEGLDILGAVGMDLVVIPHWNNAEGGSHDTSRCFIGATRFTALLDKLPEKLGVLGLDEHTAIVIDLDVGCFEIHGIGSAWLVRGGMSHRFQTGSTYSLETLKGSQPTGRSGPVTAPSVYPSCDGETTDLWPQVHALSGRFQEGLAGGSPKQAAGALLELDRILWQAQADHELPEVITEMRDVFREQLAVIGTRSFMNRTSLTKLLGPAVEALLDLRGRLREQRDYRGSDAIRDALQACGVNVSDTPDGPRWKITGDKEISNAQSS